MPRVTALVLLHVAALSHLGRPEEVIKINEDTCGLSFSDRIVGGVNAQIGQYPWLARLGYNKSSGLKFECGGALITRLHVLTATHCVQDIAPFMVVRVDLGEYDTGTDEDCVLDKCADPIQTFEPVEIVLPEEYNDPTMKHDIAIIKLNKPAKITTWVRPICLPVKGDVNIGKIMGTYADVAGWGLTHSHNAKGASILQTVKLPVVAMKKCRKVFLGLELGREQICAGGEEGKDSCSGDSGGPLMRAYAFRDKGPRIFAIGVVSLGSKQCGRFEAPALYTSVMYYMKWIIKNVETYHATEMRGSK